MATTDLSGMGITSSRTETQPEQKQVAPNFDATNVNDQLSSTLNSNSLLMRVAKSQGQAAANQRGLGNSSIGTEAAQRAMVDAALPIAQQNATQAQADKSTANEVVANTHGKYLTAVQDAIDSYNERYAAVMADSNMTAANKTTLVNNMKSELNSSLKMYSSLYSNISTIRPDWSSFPTITLPGVSLG